MTPEDYINSPKNTHATEVTKETVTEPIGASKPRKKKRNLFDITDMSKYIGFEGVVANLSFLLFIAFLFLLYIGNNHYAMKSIKKLNQNEQQVKQLKWEYINLKSELEHKSQQSWIAEQLRTTGIQELKQPPIKIQVLTNGRN